MQITSSKEKERHRICQTDSAENYFCFSSLMKIFLQMFQIRKVFEAKDDETYGVVMVYRFLHSALQIHVERSMIVPILLFHPVDI
jgi:hypothetical protein